ncbi:MAG TPA: hypothetical protein VLA64_00065, partial [Azonexus sp.]|nr:hypothetical protein [Azonexus sp.]
MHFPSLPEAGKNISPAFHDANSARVWLGTQPQAQPSNMLAALCQQIAAIDATAQPPSSALEQLNLMRSAGIPAVETLESRFNRKALPMLAEDQRSFELVQQFWTRLGIAYLRRVADLVPASQSVALNRAASALRMAEYCHFQAARECPELLDRLLFEILAQASQSSLLQQPLADPDFPHLGEANIAGHLSWAFLLRLIDPYHLNANQLVVANRAISRWRELCDFQLERENDPKSQAVDLTRLLGRPLPAGSPRWLNVRPLVRKSRRRIEAITAGESLDALKLGRELSPTACIRLLEEINTSLRGQPEQPSTEIGEIELCFGCENAYAVFREESLNPTGGMGATSASLAHQRMAMFGFDRVSQMPNAVKNLNVPGEIWNLVDGKAIRSAEQAGTRHHSPCLIASRQHGNPRLGVMLGLQSTDSGALTAKLQWFEGSVEAGWLKQGETKIPAFLLRNNGDLSLILPPNARPRLDTPCPLEDTSINRPVP